MIFTVGHSTRRADEFLALLEAHGVTGLADVRTVPRSRRHPHFSRESLEQTLPPGASSTSTSPILAAFARPGAIHRTGRGASRGSAGTPTTCRRPTFEAALDSLLAFASRRQVAVMCAEAKWWQCHRQLVADALVVRGIEVRHIMTKDAAPAHELTPFARVDGTHLLYPALV